MLGNWLKRSEWTGALVQANTTSAGTAESFIRTLISHLTKTLHTHYVSHSRETLCFTPSLIYHKPRVNRISTLRQMMCDAVNTKSPVQLLVEDFSGDPDATICAIYSVRGFPAVHWVIYQDHGLDVCSRPHPLLEMATSPYPLNDDPGWHRSIRPEVAKEFQTGKFAVNKTGNKFSARPVTWTEQCSCKRFRWSNWTDG